MDCGVVSAGCVCRLFPRQPPRPGQRSYLRDVDTYIDARTILLQWRYFVEGDALAAFDITRSSEGVSTTIGTIAVTPSSGWQNASFRDSVFIAGVEVQYQVLARDPSGVVTAVASGRIRVEGTVISAVKDPENLRIRLTWADEPPGTTGYEVLRSGEVIFSTDDPTIRTFDDESMEGNTVYNYQVRTYLPEG